MRQDLPVLILAGGEGRRIGGGKPARLLGGTSLLDRAISFARGWSAEVAVAARAPLRPGLPALADDPTVEGPLGGLAAGLRHARDHGADHLLVLPCDMPFLPADMPDRLCAGIGENGAALAMSGGAIHPVCGLWRVHALQRLGPYLATGRRSLHGFAEAVGFAAIEWPCAPVDPFFNINSEADLVRAEALLSGP